MTRAIIPDGSLHIETFSPLSLAAYIEQCATVLKFNKRERDAENPDGKWLPANFPKEDAATLIADVHKSNLPVLKAIISAPTMRPDGSIIQAEGYDEQTCLYLDSDGIDFGLSQIPAKPTLQDAERAMLVLEELISEFPFVDLDDNAQCASKSVALAAMLTALVRPMLPTAPMFCFSAPVAGSGKTKLANLVATLATARPAAIISYNTDENEFQKGGAALLMQGSAVNCLDNVNGPLKSDWLCQVLTAPEITSRVLGESRNVTTPTLCTWIATGNNIEPQGDLTRRILFCKIDPETARPDERRFNFDPIARCLADWPRYVRAGLTLLKAYRVAGCPAQDIPPYGDYTAWSDIVRSALVWAGAPDPCGMREALEAGDTERLACEAILGAWHAAFKSVPTTAKKALEHAAVKEAFGALLGDKQGEVSVRSAGRLVVRLADRRFGNGLRFSRMGGDGSSGLRWVVLS